MLYFDVRHFCLASDNDIVDVLSLGEPRVDLKRPPIPQDEGGLLPRRPPGPWALHRKERDDLSCPTSMTAPVSNGNRGSQKA